MGKEFLEEFLNDLLAEILHIGMMFRTKNKENCEFSKRVLGRIREKNLKAIFEGMPGRLS